MNELAEMASGTVTTIPEAIVLGAIVICIGLVLNGLFRS